VSEPFLGEIKIVAFNFPPRGWAMCNGQLLPINQNQALFSLLGTTYGGNGQTTFALPDLRGRTGIHTGGGHTLGERAGEAAHTLSIAELPAHTHVASGTSNVATQKTPAPSGTVGYAQSGQVIYGGPSNLAAMSPSAVANAGGSQAHENTQPSLVLSFCIALIGIFPSQS
jgi:microcystin-dependent protein